MRIKGANKSLQPTLNSAAEFQRWGHKMKGLWIVGIAVGLLLAALVIYSPWERATAIEIAKAEWYKNTGEKMDKDYPLEVFSRDGVWLVTVRLPLHVFGGGPAVEIDKKTRKVVGRYMTQ